MSLTEYDPSQSAVESDLNPSLTMTQHPIREGIPSTRFPTSPPKFYEDTLQTGEQRPLSTSQCEKTRLYHKRRRILLWFRRDLRLHDNGALHAAIQATDSDTVLFPVYILHRPENKKCGAVRFQFLLECLEDIDTSLRQKQSRLLVFCGEAISFLTVLMQAWKITDLIFEKFQLPYAIKRDEKIMSMAQTLHINVTTVSGATLHDPKEIVTLNHNQVPLDFQNFLDIVSDMPQPRLPLLTPSQLPSFESVISVETLCECFQAEYLSQSLLNITEAQLLIDTIIGKAYGLLTIPALDVFGYLTPSQHSFLYGGESVALERLEVFCSIEERVGCFEKPKTSPVQMNPPSTTALSPYLAFGCLSVRALFYRIMFIQLNFSSVSKGSPATSLDGQLMWREFFYCYAHNVPEFASPEQNPLCRKIGWRLQNEDSDPLTTHSSSKEEDLVASEQFTCWARGKTGFPWIDAIMRQILTEGWAHHLARHAVACFLTRGDLYISWIHGAKLFQELLIDMDWAINVGNWLWVSASCFFHDFQNVFSPSTFPQQYYNEQEAAIYIKHYIPELQNMPDRYVFEPWRAPLNIQKSVNCLIGKDYPFPILDHHVASKKCILALKRCSEAAN
uniref:Cryptochrome putative n=1 Tax=Albugo laibachii Nc14 TaxID=890382 RepID=F0W1D7_9STRA|nr:cryptochrome putative [Albugo laibachii Nc14]|eukprot:CCA14865.1 cryptochrome putative [Albugo laibachii Nc14]